VQIGCSILYFIVALLDKWVALLCGGQILGFGTVGSSKFAVGFSLAYYLIGAVLLDINAQKLHKLVGEGQNLPIASLDELHESVEKGTRGRRQLYLRMLLRYLFLHAWSLTMASSLLWLLGSSKDSVILFICYVSAYTGK
jgi:hypothetical protein